MNCCCGHPLHADACECGCTTAEADNGTDTSPTRTGDVYWNRSFQYEGQYGGMIGRYWKDEDFGSPQIGYVW